MLLVACILAVSCVHNSPEIEPEIDVIPLETMDATLRLYLLENFDLNMDGVISEEEATLVKEINIWGVSSLEGIQYFSNLEILNISHNGNYLYTIDVSQNTALKSLYCDFCDIRQLDVSGNHALETLSCRSRPGMAGELESLIINSELKFLDINGHKMTSLDFSGNKNLKELYCQSATLINLNVSQSVLEIIDCIGQKLNVLNIDDCTSLKEISCGAPSLSFVAKNCSSLERAYAFGLRHLDVSDSPLLRILECSLTGIQGFSISDNPNLEDLRIGGQFVLFDLSNNFQLVNLEMNCSFEGNINLDLSDRKKLKSFIYSGVAGKELESIKFDGCTLLEDVDIHLSTWGSMESLNFSNCSALSSLKCHASAIRELNLQGCVNLTFLDCNSNRLSELNLNDCPNLMSLSCHSNNLTELDLEDCKKLTDLQCTGNKLTRLKTNSENLSIIHCESNELTELDIVDGIRLKQLFCYENKLSSLDLTGCMSLEELDCKNNSNLESLNINDCKMLKILNCFVGSLMQLDVSNCPALTFLDCSVNRLTQLDVSNCPALTFIDCSVNRLHPSLDVSNCLEIKELTCFSNPDLVELIVNRNNIIGNLKKDPQTQIVLSD